MGREEGGGFRMGNTCIPVVDSFQYLAELLQYCKVSIYQSISIVKYFGHLMRRVASLEDSDAGRDWGQEEKGTTEDEMAGWHY